MGICAVVVPSGIVVQIPVSRYVERGKQHRAARGSESRLAMIRSASTRRWETLKRSHARLGTGILALHVVHVTRVVLALVVVLRQASDVARAGDAGAAERRAAPAEAVALRVRDVAGCAAHAKDTAAVGPASVLGNYGRRVAVRAALGTVDATRDAAADGAEWASRREHGKTRRVGSLRAEGLDVGGDITECIVGSIKACIETAGGTGTASCGRQS
ncbi:hypothetical protein B0H12DRAFT_215231 [Mycena haematopus]|nr:hypothetical protein B0H12DRAFT_215231 [Mycena haematopus]